MAKDGASVRERVKEIETGFKAEQLTSAEAERVFSQIEISPEASPWQGEEASPELFKKVGWYPKWKVETKGAVFYLPEVKHDFRDGDSRCVVGYVEVEGKIIARSFYQSKSQGLWRVLPSYHGNNVKGIMTWLHKLYGEDYLSLPAEVQKALATNVKYNGKGAMSEDVETAFMGTAKFFDPSKSYVRERFGKPHHLQGNERGDKKSLVAPDKLDLKNESEKPDFSKPLDTWEEDTYLYGRVKLSVFSSKNGSLRYTFCEDQRGRAWVGSIELTNAPVLDNSMRETWVEHGNIPTPAYEYSTQDGGYGNRKDRKDFSYVDMYEKYLQHIPIIKEYKNMSEKTKGKTPANKEAGPKPKATEKPAPEAKKKKDGEARVPEKEASKEAKSKEAPVSLEKRLEDLREATKKLKDKRLKKVRDNIVRDIKAIEEMVKDEKTVKAKAVEIEKRFVELEESLKALLEKPTEAKGDKKETRKEPTWTEIVDELEKRNLFGGSKKRLDEAKKAIEAKDGDWNIREAILRGLAETVWEKEGKTRSDLENWHAAEKTLAEVKASLVVVVTEEAPAATADTDEEGETTGDEDGEADTEEGEHVAPGAGEGGAPEGEGGEGSGTPPPEGSETQPEFKMVDIPLQVINEIILHDERGKEMFSYILEGHNEQALAHCRTLFHNIRERLSPGALEELDEALEKAGYTWEKFREAWDSKIHLAVFSVLQGVANDEVKRRAAESIGLMDKVKMNWVGILKRVGVVAGVATGVALALPAVLGLTAGATIGATIGTTGILGRWWNKRVLKKEQKKGTSGKTAIEEKTEVLMGQRISEEKEKMIFELLSSPQHDIAGQISQAIRMGSATTPSAGRSVNVEAMRIQLLWERSHELETSTEAGGEAHEGMMAERTQLLALLAELEKSRKSMPDAIKADPRTQEKVKGITIKILEKIQGAKGGHLFSGEEKNKLKDNLSYAAPLFFAVGIGTAVEYGGGVVWESIRMGMGGLAGGILGYKAGEALDKRAQRKEVEGALKNIMDDVSRQLTRYSHGGGGEEVVDIQTLQKDIDRLEGHLQIGSLDYSPKLKMNGEALLREGQRVLFERKEGTIKNLIAKLQDHRVIAERQAKDDLVALQKKTGNWRKWVGLGGGAIIGALSVFGISFGLRDGQSDILEKWFGLRPGGVKDMENVALHTAHDWHPPTSGQTDFTPIGGTKAPSVVDAIPGPRPHLSVQDSYVIKKGDGLLNAANHFQGDKAQLAEMMKGIRAGHPEWAGKSNGYVLRHWRLEQIHKEGYDFGDGWRSGTKTVHAGAEVKLVFDEKGYPSLSLGNEHVSQHGVRVEDLSATRPAVQNGTDTPDWRDNANAPRANLEPEPNISNSLSPDELANTVANGPYGKNAGYGIADMIANKQANTPGSVIDRSNTGVKGEEPAALTREYTRTRTQGPNPHEPAKVEVVDKSTREPAPVAQEKRGDVGARSEQPIGKIHDIDKFTDAKLSYGERMTALAKSLTPGRALDVNGVKYLSLDGGRTIQYEIPVGNGVVRGVVDQANLPKLTELHSLLERSHQAVVDPVRFEAKMDKALEALGAEKGERSVDLVGGSAETFSSEEWSKTADWIEKAIADGQLGVRGGIYTPEQRAEIVDHLRYLDGRFDEVRLMGKPALEQVKTEMVAYRQKVLAGHGLEF